MTGHLKCQGNEAGGLHFILWGGSEPTLTGPNPAARGLRRCLMPLCFGYPVGPTNGPRHSFSIGVSASTNAADQSSALREFKCPPSRVLRPSILGDKPGMECCGENLRNFGGV